MVSCSTHAGQTWKIGTIFMNQTTHLILEADVMFEWLMTRNQNQRGTYQKASMVDVQRNSQMVFL